MKKCAFGCDNKMDCEKIFIPTSKEIEILKNKIIDRCTPYCLFKNYYYNPEINQLEKIKYITKETAKDRQKNAFFEIHKKHYPGLDFNQILDSIVNWHMSRVGCEWCGCTQNPVIDHVHEISSVYEDCHIGMYRGLLCSSCNSIEKFCKNHEDKKKYLEKKNYGPETIDFILKKWYNS